MRRSPVGRDGTEDRNPEIDGENDDRDGTHHRGRDARAAREERIDRERHERRQRETRDRHQPLGHARRSKRRHGPPQRLVERRARPESQQRRNHHGEPEKQCEAASMPDCEESGDRDERHDPTREHELLDAPSDTLA